MESEGPAEKYRAVIDAETQDEPVGQRWGKVESALRDEGVLIHPPHQGDCGRHGTEEQCVTSGELTESPGGTGVSGPISESEVASYALSVVGRLNSTHQAWRKPRDRATGDGIGSGRQPAKSIREISIAAEARRSDGSPLVLPPHDCRRVFASEHLNNNTPVHIIQALLGHASPDTVMIYAKLYPSQLIEEYRKTVRSLYSAYYGGDGLKNPTAEEWAAFTASCNLREMGTHLCALPTGEHCPKGLICLGCTHAQPKKSAVPTGG